METISLVGLNKAAVLAVLYNASRPLGLGFIHYDPKPMTVENAQALLDGGQTKFDYLKGRVMKVDLSGEVLDPYDYDENNGQGAAAAVIAEHRRTGNANSAVLEVAHRSGLIEAAKVVKDHLHEEHEMREEKKDIDYIRIGLADVAHVLGPAVDKALEE